MKQWRKARMNKTIPCLNLDAELVLNHCNGHTHFYIPSEDLFVIALGTTNFVSVFVLLPDKPTTRCCGQWRWLFIQSITCRATLAPLLATCCPSVTRASRKLIRTASPRHLGGHVPLSACVGICLSIKLLLDALPSPHPANPTPPTSL